ncbi:MAG: 2-oxoglutarate dehydrogenase complex dihydrolipoyllysine-residue succinyltransferase [Planctomycetes bacterium]|nr:2-oxoglutarate dehydrogenase complex dihydrolipoyllysine-residue succinyltransferase [Planctomycetota bacterium]
MSVEISIPSPGESITEVVIGPWLKSSGDWVEKDEIVVEIESDKVTLEVPAPESGILNVKAQEGAEKQVGEVIASIDTNAQRPANVEAVAQATDAPAETVAQATIIASTNSDSKATSVAKKVAADKGVNLTELQGTGTSGRITKSDVLAVVGTKPTDPGDIINIIPSGSRGIQRKKMSKLRQRIAERLVFAQHNAAMLTTFNEVDMSQVMELRKAHKEDFLNKHGVKLGFMSFFVQACASALKQFPIVNGYIDGNEIEFHDYVDISVAVGTDKGLVVPVLRNTEKMSFADVERTIKELAGRARDNKLTMDEMTGGTFTISNGGVYGSLMSTPILNPPQSAILGMHKIMPRAIEDADTPGQIVLKPMMYLALSYDHRIVDGEQAVSFLVHIKDAIEHPQRLLLGL